MSLSSGYWKKKKENETLTPSKSSDSLSSGYFERIKAIGSGDDDLALFDGYWNRKNGIDTQDDITTVDDIGPVKRTYFQKGAFEDGYQFGDIMKTLGATTRDVLTDVQAGAYNIIENTIDAGATLLSNVPAWEDELSAFVAKDIIDEKHLASLNTASLVPFDVINRIIQGEDWKDAIWGNSYEEDSLVGDKTDSLGQSGGQLALQYALQGLGVPWWVTSGVSSYGSQAEQAFQEGATAKEANVSALISAGAEVLSEKIFGGFKFHGKALSDGISDMISRGVSDKLLKSVLKFGLDAGGEALEEVFSAVASRFGQWLTYQNDETIGEMLASEEAFDEYLESAIGGGLLGGGNTALNITQNTMAGRDPVSGLSSAEEQVVRDLFDSRVAESEKGGEKLSEFDKNKLWDEVIEQMDRGEIDIGDIERILGGDTFKTYQDTVSKEDAIWNEFDSLQSMKRGDMTGKQVDREAELRKIIEEDLAKSTKRDDLAKQLQSEVFSVAKDSRLAESYNERVRRGQAFEADVSKYSESERKVIQDAIDSGILNNTRKTHEFVDWVAKVAGAKGLEFKFTNNEKLRGTAFEVKTEDGKTVMPNGYRDGNTIGINTNSKKNVNVVAGHEITHVLEGTPLYQALQDAVFRYAVAKDGQAKFDQRLKSVEDLYKGVSTDAKGELTADLVGEYLFTDKDFIKRLTTENKSLAKKVFDEIKHLWKLATAGSHEKRELEIVKKAFEDAYREVGKETKNTKSDTQHSLSEDSDVALEDLSIDDIELMPDEEFYELCRKIGIYDYLEMDTDVSPEDDSSIEDIAEEMDVEPEVINILFHRSGLGNSHVEANNMAVMTQDRINQRIHEHGASNPDYARAYITRISPKDFIDMTVYEQNMDREKFDTRVRGDFDGLMDDWDYEKALREKEEPPMLVVDKSNGKIIGHNGRHRMRALEKAGIESVEIEVEFHDEDGYLVKYDAQTIPDMAISSQFDTAIETHISNIIPLNNAHRGEIGQYYGENAHENAGIKYSLGDSSSRQGNYNVTAKDIAIDTPYSLDDIAPVDPKKTPKKINPVKDSRFIPGAKKKAGAWSWVKEHLLDNGMVFEELADATGNRKLDADWNFIRNAPAAAQHLIGEGDKEHGVKSLKSIKKAVEKAGKMDAFDDYMLHKLHIDRMTVVERGLGKSNVGVWGNVTADESRKMVEEYEKNNPEFLEWAEDIYTYNKHLRSKLVEAGIITQELSDKWEQMFPHYVPIRRKGFDEDYGFQMESKDLRFKTPLWRFEGSDRLTESLFDTMGDRTLITFKAVAKNNFGVELMNTLDSVIESNDSSLDDFTGDFDMDAMFGEHEGVPTYTVFQNGKRVTYAITEEMYDAMKPSESITHKAIPVLSHFNNFFRNVTTQYNPVFALTNAVKDFQDVIINSQHAGKTYFNILSGKALGQIATKGKYYQEYLANGGKTSMFFDEDTKSFKEESMPKKVLDKVFFLNDVIETVPRLAEYIASRDAGKSIEEAMLDSARVTTNFAAGGDWTKFFNRNGATFLNASVQGALQQVRNVKQAHQKGAMGYVSLVTRCAIGGLVPVLLNNLMWEDDEEYEQLADYVKEGYYIVGKYGDGKFIRIPKGRTLAVLQEAIDLVMDTATGDDEVDLARFMALGSLALDNLAPNNPIENNIFAPIMQTFYNRTWYGEELVPERLSDLPAAEQFDEKTDSISKWLAQTSLGQALNWSPYKINYLLNTYSGGIGDFFLPMITPRSESGDDSLLGKLTAPVRDKFVTDSVLNSQIVTDFYDVCDELERNANSMHATEADAFKQMYIQSVCFDTNELYAEKRAIQNSDMSESEKYHRVREIQEQINSMMEEALNSYQNPQIDGLYAEVGSKRFNFDEESGNWYPIRETNADGSPNWYYELEQKVTQGLGISYGEYWNNREEYNFAYEKPGEYALSQAVGGYQDYQTYHTALWDIKADKDEYGQSINGTRKKKVVEYINGLDCEYGMKILLYKSEYPNDDKYNYDIIEYLNERDDISYEQMETILKELGFNVDSKGRITW